MGTIALLILSPNIHLFYQSKHAMKETTLCFIHFCSTMGFTHAIAIMYLRTRWLSPPPSKSSRTVKSDGGKRGNGVHRRTKSV